MTTTTPATYEIQGRTLNFPIVVRDADSWAAQFLVPAKAAQRIVDPTGLEVAQPIPGRAVCNIAVVDYRDTDLDAYHELAIAFLVRPHDRNGGSAIDRTREFAKGEIGVYIHQLPVTQAFTNEAGRTIWGYPKFLSDIEITRVADEVVAILRVDGTHVLTLRMREGGPIPLPQQNLATYSLRDGVLRRTEWDQTAKIEARLGGASLVLGAHPIADELRTLKLPKRALMCSTMRHMRASFGPADVL